MHLYTLHIKKNKLSCFIIKRPSLLSVSTLINHFKDFSLTTKRVFQVTSTWLQQLQAISGHVITHSGSSLTDSCGDIDRRPQPSERRQEYSMSVRRKVDVFLLFHLFPNIGNNFLLISKYLR